MKRFLITGVFLWMLQPATAQEMLGSTFSNYAGQMGIGLNPASIVGAPWQWELNILSGDFAAQNNYMYLKANSKLVRNSVKGEAVDEDRFTDNYTESDKWMYSSSFLKYPSFIWSGKKFAAAASISTRAEVSARDIPHHLAKFMKEGFDYDPLQQTDWSADKGKVNILNWHEFSLTGGMLLHDDGVHYWSGALTLNYNFGLNGLYIDIHDMSYNSEADTLLRVYNLDADYGHAWPVENTTKNFFNRKGGGFSTSAGIRYMYNRNDSYFDPCLRGNSEKPYDLRIGISLIDVGYINYKANTSTYELNNVSSDWYGIDTVKFNSIHGMDSLLGLQFGGSPDAFRTGSAFKMATPAAVTMDVDVPLKNWFFINVAVIQRLPVGKNRIYRMNEVSFAPRVEFRRFEFSMPFSVYEYSAARLGAAVRIGAFTVGSDVLSSLIGISDAYGADIYFGIALHGLGDCGRSGGGGKSKRTRLEKCNTPGR